MNTVNADYDHIFFSMIMQKGNLNPRLAESEQKLYRRNHIKSKTHFNGALNFSHGWRLDL